ncbi:peptidoglycan-binding protein [Paenarthrobacter sp. DKR-5]|uniref:N-acetylmuramoyl-L-alanine amidase n=1 Tax=Paenarthrobacter sp. DKR-5 TaxID=2835535 RepID=UPI001BDBC503|nr:peptidoglycan-binding protein [Paenarthrobacter sp. DKR-5]MBT1004312.1 peptidoglycan-binding protein [Paenarthrobacter sp. DKR-5]
MTDQYEGRVLQRGAVGRRVVTLRERLLRAGVSVSYLAPETVENPAAFDDHVDAAVRAFQQLRGLIVDGVVGGETERALTEAQFQLGDRVLSLHEEIAHRLRGDDVAELQRQLSHLGFYYGHIDGEFGQRTSLAVSELQQNLGLPVSGACDSETIGALARVNRTLTPSKAFSLRDYERLQQASSALHGRVISIDPAPAARSYGTAVDGTRETFRIAQRLADALRAFGARAILSRDAEEQPTLAERVSRIGASGAGINLTLQCEWHSNPAAQGTASFYWGDGATGDARSAIGERAAGIIHRELVARTGMTDLGTHGRSWDILRIASMPSLCVDLGYLSSPHDSDLLTDPTSQEVIAHAVMIGLQRLFLLEDDEQATGTMRVEDVMRYNPPGDS